jgi:hypothetical protein
MCEVILWKHIKQQLINISPIASVLAIGMGFGLPGIVKWRAHEALTAWDDAVLLNAAIIFMRESCTGYAGFTVVPWQAWGESLSPHVTETLRG